MKFQITARYGRRRTSYHTFTVEAANARQALLVAAEAIPDEIADEIDLVELRIAVDPDARRYVEGPA